MNLELIKSRLELMLLKEGYKVKYRVLKEFLATFKAREFVINYEDKKGSETDLKLMHLITGFSYALEKHKITTVSDREGVRIVQILERD